jgi:uncharacterized protein (DUF2461 family)
MLGHDLVAPLLAEAPAGLQLAVDRLGATLLGEGLSGVHKRTGHISDYISGVKSPYKTNIAAHNEAGYISLSAHALGVGAGLYMPSGPQLARFRAAVADDRTGTELVGLVAKLTKKGIAVHAHEVLKSAPRGYPKDHPRIDLLRYKGVTAWQEWPVGAWLDTATAKGRIVDFLRASAPLRQWLDQNVGPDPV